MKNSNHTRRVILPGSQKGPAKGARIVGSLKPDERVEVTVRVRARQSPARSAEFAALATKSVSDRNPMSREEFAARFGADPADLERIEQFAHEQGLDVIASNAAQRIVRMSGKAQAMQDAFGVKLKLAAQKQARFRHRSGTVSVPKDIAPIVEGVFGLDNRPFVRPHFHLKKGAKAKSARAGRARTFTPLEIAKLYNFPAKLDGSGQCIAILEFGGGYRLNDLKRYFKDLGVALPKVSAISVDGAHNSPTGNPASADGEVMLDIEVAGAIAPKAKIAVYFAPNTDDGFLNALRAAVHDSLRKPSVVSISWGAPELASTRQTLTDYDAVCQEAALLGVTICCSAGDHGTDDSERPAHRANADFPASSPHVLACGGTRLEASGSAISSEKVWNNRDGWATGGGVSEVFPMPSWQANAKVPRSLNPGGKKGRGVPDVCGDADGETGYRIRVDGFDIITGGTSAVAPLWAGLIARINQKLGKPVGFVNPVLYKSPTNANAFRDITVGDNAAFASSKGYKARAGWDPCTGLGSPDGTQLLNDLNA